MDIVLFESYLLFDNLISGSLTLLSISYWSLYSDNDFEESYSSEFFNFIDFSEMLISDFIESDKLS